MKKQLWIYMFLFGCINLNAQPPVIQWEKSYGGYYNESGYSIALKGNFYAVLGYACSHDGDVVGKHDSVLQSSDFWFLRLNNNGTIFSAKCLGGSNFDDGYSISSTFDGGFILTGYTISGSPISPSDGDVTGWHCCSLDIWVVKVDSIGNIQWQKCLGGMNSESGYNIFQTRDSGYFVTGETDGDDGDVHGWHGGNDVWCVKMDFFGNIQWTKCLGGSSYDQGNCAIQTSDGGYLLTAGTGSDDGDITNLHGTGEDVWVVKLNSVGTLIWQKCFGGTSGDFPNTILDAGGGNFIVSASTYSNDSDVTGMHGSEDFWLFKADSIGTIIWSHCYGGSGFESARAASMTSDGGVIMAGMSSYDDGMVTGNNGFYDYWVVKVDSMGNFEWGKCLGGSNEDEPHSIEETSDGGYIVTGSTYSNDSDVAFNHGGMDLWVVKLSPIGLNINDPEYLIMDLAILQNESKINLRFFSKHSKQSQLVIYNITGQKIINATIEITEGINYYSLPQSFAKGIYSLQLKGKGFSETKKFVVK